jgi:hypothetical protein
MEMDKKLNIANIAKGSLLERADIEIENVLRNILDKNTDWKKARKVTLELEFKATNDHREDVFVSLKAKSSISPYNPVMTQIYVGKDDDGQVTASEYTKNKEFPGQQPIVDKETGEILNEVNTGTNGRKIVNINR